MKDEVSFFEMGCQSNFSFLEGASHPQELVVAAQELGLAGAGLADRNTVAGVVRAHQEAKTQGFRYQPGARLVFSDDTPDILAYPQNREGWGKLCRLLTVGNRRAEKGACILHEADLFEWADEMLLVVLPFPHEPGGASLEPVLSGLRQRFRDKVYLALTPRFDGMDRFHHASLAGMAQTVNVPLIATNLPLYHEPGRRPVADVVHAIRTHQTVGQVGLALAANAERHMKSGAEMARLTKTYPEAVANTIAFMGRFNFTLDELKYEYPDETIAGETAKETLRRLVWEGAQIRFPDGIKPKEAAQIEHELQLIQEREYEPYFLTVRNIVHYARSVNILCQGRGSAANSIVCYCLGITEINPVFTGLLFERFISTARDEPPDIDVDFEHERREEVIQYIYRKYGRDHAGLAATVICYRTRSAGREVAKAFGFSEDVRSALSSTVWGWSSDGLTMREAQAAGLDLENEGARQLLHYGSVINGFPRHLSQHVGGFVITRSRLDEVVPLMNTAMEGRTMVEWDKDDLDALKILKIDVLALGMLTALRRSLDMLRQHYGISHDIDSLMKDQQPQVYDMICRADTIGVFQIESRAQMSMLPRLRPKEYYDLVIEVAIVRPGPIQGDMVHPYLKRRDGKEEVVYPKEELRDVLEKTKGIPLFQEQAMRIAMVAAEFSADEADRLRRAMATFRRNGTIHQFEKKMIEGMVRRGYQRDFAQRCFNQIKGFGDYGFPESHAASFALLVYASSWVKAYYPDIFCAALLNSQPMGFYAPAQLVRDAREHGVDIRPVDVNHSLWDSTLEDGRFDLDQIGWRHREMRGVIRTNKAVRLGFRQIKGLHEKDLKRLIERRGGGYDSVRDLWLRTGLPRFVIERLAEADAFSSIGLSRRDALWAAQALDVESAVEVLPLFSELDGKALQQEEEVDLPKMLPGESVIEDYRAVKLSLKAHPVSFLRDDFTKAGILRSIDLEDVPNGRVVTIAGLVLVRQRPGSASGVVFMAIEDETGVANSIIWPKVFEKFRPIVMGARLVKIRGRVQKAEGVIHVVAGSLVNGSDELRKLTREAFPLLPLANGDEVRRPVLVKQDRETGGNAAVHVMPKGRNFH